MWWAGSEAQLYLTRTAAYLRMRGEDAVRGFEGDAEVSMNAAVQACATAGRAPRKLGLRLSGAWAQAFMLPATQGLQKQEEAKALAASMASQFISHEGPHVVWLDAWQADRDCLVVAVPQSIVDLAVSTASRHGMRLSRVSPAWNEALALDTQPGLQMLVVREIDAVTTLLVDGTRIAKARTIAPLPDMLAPHVGRWAMGWGVNGSAVMQAELAFAVSSSDRAFDVRWAVGPTK